MVDEASVRRDRDLRANSVPFVPGPYAIAHHLLDEFLRRYARLAPAQISSTVPEKSPRRWTLLAAGVLGATLFVAGLIHHRRQRNL